MSKKIYLAMAAMAGMLASSPSLYDEYFGGRIKRVERKVTKCSECPEFRHRCPTRNGEMKPCSKYK